MLHMFGTDDERLGSTPLVSPASSIDRFHNAYDGGYIDYVLGVCKTVRGVKVLLQSIGANIDFTDDENDVRTFNHDLGKLGSLDGEQYQYNDSEWHRKNQGKLYNINPDIHYMSVTDRSIWLLQHFEIKITEKEFLAIKLSDGMYDEANPQYLKVFSKEVGLKTELPRVIHWADHMTCLAEKSNMDNIMKFDP